ncbi:NrfD/PsrC family molybdoenzyme membrane anchor subunit [Chloroflexota bacterium]
MINPEKQTSWGWPIAGYLFLAGVGGSTFLFSFIFNILDLYEPVARLGTLIGPILVLIGTVFLLFDLGSVGKTYLLFSTVSRLKSSWMSKGSWILALFIIFGLLYSLPAFGAFSWLPWSMNTGAGLTIGIIGALLAVFTVAYPGFLLGVAKGVPFWNTPVLPPLFFLSGLDTGLALLVLLALFSASGVGVEIYHIIGAGDIALIIMVLIVLAAYIEITRQSNIITGASVHMLKTPIFIVGVLLIGLIIPLCLLIYSVFTTDTLLIRILAGLSGICILVGGALLRYSVIKVGIPITLLGSFPLPVKT